MNAQNYTPNDAGIDANIEGFMVTTTGGNVSIDYTGGNTSVLLAVPKGVWIPVGRAERINATGTTAVGFLVV
tara:strand:- start:2 stop:217 length:216 start_codon:yes stop_codon:yes gene_type:complete